MNALTAVIPWWGRALALLAFAAALLGFGWVKGASHVQAQWGEQKTEVAVVVAKQAARVETIKAAQSTINQGVKDETDSRIAAVHAAYGRLRQSAGRSCAVPAVPGSAGEPAPEPADAGPAAGDGLKQESYGQLAERCAVSTAIGLGWQEWYAAQAATFTGEPHGQSDLSR